MIVCDNFSPRPGADTSHAPLRHTRPQPLAEPEAYPGSAPSPAKRVLARGMNRQDLDAAEHTTRENCVGFTHGFAGCGY